MKNEKNTFFNLFYYISILTSQFLGVWHEIQSYYSPNVIGSCSRAQYTDGGDRVLVVNSQIINQTLFTIEGYATVTSGDGSGELGVVLEVAPGSKLLYIMWTFNRYCDSFFFNTNNKKN